MLTKMSEIRDRLHSYDRQYFEQLYRQQCYAFGMKWDSMGAYSGDQGQDFPYFPDIKVEALGIGQSRRILNNAMLGLSRILTSEPEPEYPQVDSTTAEIRKQIWLEQWRMYNYNRQHEFAWVDLDSFGNGVLQYGPMKVQASGQMYTCCRHIPATQFIYDSHARSIGDARWAACVHYAAPEDVAARYGKRYVDGNVSTAFHSGGRKKFKYVRLTEYYDLGYGTGEPTYGLIAGAWSNDPIKTAAMPYPRLPIAYGEYMAVPGMSRPIGKILLQQATQEAINELESHLRMVVKRGTGFDIVDTTQLNKQDVARLNRGDFNVRVRLETPDPNGRPPYIRIQSQEVAMALLQLLSLYERQYNADSQSTELDRGSLSDTKRTATENQLLDMRSQQGMTLTKHQTLLFYRRSVEVHDMVAAVADREPIAIDLMGANIQLNDPANPALRLDQVYAERSRVLIGSQAVEPQDVMMKQQQRLANLKVLEPYVQAGLLSMSKYLDELIKAVGEKDPDEWLANGEAAGQMQQPGMDQAVAGPEGQPQANPLASLMGAPEALPPIRNLVHA